MIEGKLERIIYALDRGISDELVWLVSVLMVVLVVVPIVLLYGREITRELGLHRKIPYKWSFIYTVCAMGSVAFVYFVTGSFMPKPILVVFAAAIVICVVLFTRDKNDYKFPDKGECRKYHLLRVTIVFCRHLLCQGGIPSHIGETRRAMHP